MHVKNHLCSGFSLNKDFILLCNLISKYGENKIKYLNNLIKELNKFEKHETEEEIIFIINHQIMELEYLYNEEYEDEEEDEESINEISGIKNLTIYDSDNQNLKKEELKNIIINIESRIKFVIHYYYTKS